MVFETPHWQAVTAYYLTAQNHVGHARARGIEEHMIFAFARRLVLSLQLRYRMHDAYASNPSSPLQL